MGRCLGFLLISTLLLSLLPVASAQTTSGFGYSGGLTSPAVTGLSTVVAWSYDGSLLAISYYDEVVITTVDSRRTLVTLTLEWEVRSLEFSDDDSHLVIGLSSPYRSTIAVAVFETGGWSRISFTEEGSDVDSVSILPGGMLFAVSDGDGGVIEYELTTGNELRRFSGGHTGRVTCISHSPDGGQLLTGGEDGVVNLWDRNGPSIEKYWPADDPISDCAISPDGEWIVWTSGSLMQVRKLDDHTLVSTVHLAGDSKNLEWSPDSTGIWLLTEFAAPQLQLFSSSTWAQEHVIDIGHKATFFSVAPGQRLFAVTSSGKVTALYSMDRWQPGFGVTGTDLDQDGIPNPRDSDDDGDGIPDEFDNICPSGSHCPSYPDVDLIRSVTITANGRLLSVTDTVQLNLSQSVLLRELAAYAILDDWQVDYVEASRIDRMLCEATDEDQVLSAWASVISVDAAGVLEGGRVTCTGKTGLVGTRTADTHIRVEVSWTVEFTLSNPLSKPYNLSYDLGVPSPYGTVAMATPQWPVRMLFYHEGNLVFDSGVVAKSAPAGVLYVESDPPEDSAIIDFAAEWLTANAGLIAGTFVILVTILVVTVRLRNRVDFKFKQEDEDEEEEFGEYDDDFGGYQYRQGDSMDDHPEYGVVDLTPPILETSQLLSTVAATGPPPARSRRKQPDRPPPDQRKTRKVVKPDDEESEVEQEEIVDAAEEESDPAMRIAADLAAETSEVDDAAEEPEDTKAIEDALTMVTSKAPVVQPEFDPLPPADEPRDSTPP
ncbi:MAG: WD40 repeat domain-containing protein, partial [Candidatus Poseidoniales archaeon]|nr:WD40 repeat domain-containing protein [Candidatus Poseidoniales archaeon]